MSENISTVELSASLLDDVSKITDANARAQFLAQQHLESPVVVKQLNEMSRTKLRIDPRQSLSLAEAAVAVANSLHSEELLGPSLRAKANALYVLGDNQASLACHGQALAIFQRRGNQEEEARTLNASIQPHILLGDYASALTAAKAARDIFAVLGDNRRLAHVEINVGNIYHRQDRFEEAVASYERAYEMFLPFDDAEGLGIALYNLSVCLISLNDFPRALATYQRAREVFVPRGMKLLIGQADYNIAYLYYLRGEYVHAIEMLRAAREQSEANGDAHILALCYLDLSDIYLELNLSAQAAEVAHEGIHRFKKLGMGYEEAKCLANEAIAWSQQGKPLRALDLFDEARAVFVREKNFVWPSLIDLYRALAFFDEGRPFEAQKACQTALDFFETSTSPGKAALCHILLSRIELQKGDCVQSLRHIDGALAKIAGLEMPVLEYQAQYFMGHAHSAAGDEDLACKAYQKALQGLEGLRAKLRKEELKSPFIKDKAIVYQRLIEICLNRGDQASLCEAFGYIERTKHRNLADIILDEIHETPKSIAGKSEMVRRIRDLREELNWYYHRIEIAQLSPEQNDPAKVKQLQAEANAREQALIDTLRDIPESASELQLFRPAEIAPLAKIQEALAPRAALIEYFALGDDLLAALVTRDGMEILPVTLLNRAAELVSAFRADISRCVSQKGRSASTEAAGLQTAQVHLQRLYSELLEPLLERAAGNHLIVVPHGVLGSIPFHSLFDGREYLIDRFMISYAPSASVFARPKAIARPGGKSLILAPDLGGPTATDELLAEIASSMESPQIFLGDAANLETLRDSGSGARWIHIAGPQNDSTQRAAHPGIAFGNSYLTPTEISQLQLRPELMTITGSAPGLELDAADAGDAIRSLQRGFLEAGVESLLATFWDAEPVAAAEFLKVFYANCSREGSGVSKARAFQIAARAMRAHHPHPASWSPFYVCSSETGPA